MKYTDQKRIAYLQIFLGFFIIGYNAVKYIKSGFDMDSVNFPILLAIGVVLPLSSLFGLKRVKAGEEMRKKLTGEKEEPGL